MDVPRAFQALDIICHCVILLTLHFIFFPLFTTKDMFFRQHLRINQILHRHQNKIKYQRRRKQ